MICEVCKTWEILFGKCFGYNDDVDDSSNDDAHPESPSSSREETNTFAVCTTQVSNLKNSMNPINIDSLQENIYEPRPRSDPECDKQEINSDTTSTRSMEELDETDVACDESSFELIYYPYDL